MTSTGTQGAREQEISPLMSEFSGPETAGIQRVWKLMPSDLDCRKVPFIG